MPGKYSLTDIKIDNAQKQSVNIIAEYQWGPQLLESICLTKKGEFSADKLQVIYLFKPTLTNLNYHLV